MGVAANLGKGSGRLEFLGGYDTDPWASLSYSHKLHDGIALGVDGGLRFTDRLEKYVFGGLRYDF